MEAVFADTTYWIALLNRKDELHDTAKRVSAGFSTARVVTTDMVFAELLNDFAARGVTLRNAASKLVQNLKANARAIVVPQTSELFTEALSVYIDRPDKDWVLPTALPSWSCGSRASPRRLPTTVTSNKQGSWRSCGSSSTLRRSAPPVRSPTMGW